MVGGTQQKPDLSSARDQDGPATPSATAPGAATTPHAAELTVSILDTLFAGRGLKGLSFRFWDGTVWPPSASPSPRFTVVLNHPGSLRRMFWPPTEATVGESYARGDFDVEGDLVASISVDQMLRAAFADPRIWARVVRRLLALPETSAPSQAWRGAASLGGRTHSAERDKAAITYHYDLPGDFYAVFLDPRMQYSCAYFREPGMSLADAQTAKLEHICRKLDLRPGERLLDIGCGWGGLVAYAAEKFGVQAVGITNSSAQAERGRRRLADMGLADKANIKVVDYRLMDEPEAFDKIVSVGMFEHVGRKNLLLYFQRAYRLLRPGGRFLCHGIAGTYTGEQGLLAATVQRWAFDTNGFINRYIFPDGELEPINETLGAAERAGFEVRDVESLREHYAQTIRHWLRNLDAGREAAAQIVDVPTYRIWRLFFAGCIHSFDTAQNNVYQSLLVKRFANGESGCPPSREYMYRA